MKNRKRILQWGRILLVLIWVLAGAFLVVHASMHAFQHQLYFRHNNLSASSLFLSLFTRQALFILAFMLAVMLLTLHIVTATGIDDILKCALLMLTAAGYDACMWNRDVLFLASSRLRLFWMHTHDAMLLMFTAAMLALLLPRLVVQLKLRRAMLVVGEAAFALGVVLLWLFPPVRAGAVLIPCAALLALYTLAFLALQLRRRERAIHYLESLMLLPPALVMLLRARYLFALGSKLQSAYLNAASYIIVLYGMFTSAYVLVWQLSNIFLQRSQNRRFEEVMKIKTDVSNLLVNYCRPPARQITALSRLALDGRNGELTAAQRQILYELQDEVNKLNRHLRNIGEGHAFFRNKFLLDNHQGVYDFVTAHFNRYPALVPPMTWESNKRPLQPVTLCIEENEGTTTLRWDNSLQYEDGTAIKTPTIYNNVYASKEYPVDVHDARNLILTRTTKRQLTTRTGNTPTYYAVTTTDGFGNESRAKQLNQTAVLRTTTRYGKACRLTTTGESIILPSSIHETDCQYMIVKNMQEQAVYITKPQNREINIKKIKDGIYTLNCVNYRNIEHTLGTFIKKGTQKNRKKLIKNLVE